MTAAIKWNSNSNIHAECEERNVSRVIFSALPQYEIETNASWVVTNGNDKISLMDSSNHDRNIDL